MSKEFPDDGEEKSQGNICAAGLESNQNWEMEGFRRDVSEGGGGGRVCKELDRFTDVFDPIEDQKIGGKVVNTCEKS